MDHYSATFDELIASESEAWPDEAATPAREVEIPAQSQADRCREEVGTLGVFRGLLFGVPVALVLWAPILATGYFMLG